jgi:hypothetical protein
MRLISTRRQFHIQHVKVKSVIDDTNKIKNKNKNKNKNNNNKKRSKNNKSPNVVWET